MQNKSITIFVVLAILITSTLLVAIGSSNASIADANEKYTGTLGEGVAPIAPPHPVENQVIYLSYEPLHQQKSEPQRLRSLGKWERNEIQREAIQNQETDEQSGDQEGKRNVWGGETIYATVTAYSKSETCPGDRPCITASGKVAREGTIACPRRIPLSAKVRIDGVTYECLDRLSQRYDNRFDLWFGDRYEEALAHGIKRNVEVIIYE